MDFLFADTIDLASDGHPCEAALEFRRIIVRSSVAPEVPVDALDLAISFAWIGKTVSRTVRCADWHHNGIDPNTWEFIAALSSDDACRKNALNQALRAPAESGLEDELRHLRSTRAFDHASEILRNLNGNLPAALEVERLSILANLTRSLPGWIAGRKFVSKPQNVILLKHEIARRRKSSR